MDLKKIFKKYDIYYCNLPDRFENPSVVLILKGDEVWIYSTHDIEELIKKLEQVF